MNREASDCTSLSLLSRVEADDHEAWRLFTRLYGPIVYSWCRNAGVRAGDVDDIGQEVFRVVAQKLSAFDPSRKSSGAFRSWLWGITRLQILDYLRNAKRQPVAEGGTDHQVTMQRLEEARAEPDSVAGVTPRQMVLQSAMHLIKSEFGPRTWKAFWGMAVDGRSAKELGIELGMTAKAVRQAKFRVTKKLRELLDDDAGEAFERATTAPRTTD